MSSTNLSQNAIYAILADNVYWDVRTHFNNLDNPDDTSNSNWTPVPSDWTLLDEMRDEPSGFTARAYEYAVN